MKACLSPASPPLITLRHWIEEPSADGQLTRPRPSASSTHSPPRTRLQLLFISPTRLSPSVPNLASSIARSALVQVKLPTHLHRAANHPLASTDKALVDIRRRAHLRPRRRPQKPRKPRPYSSYQAPPYHTHGASAANRQCGLGTSHRDPRRRAAESVKLLQSPNLHSGISLSIVGFTPSRLLLCAPGPHEDF